ncbi:unnamed protein product [Parnassius apollo]|uniref:(apollo) hypothetical protein n=1 Tax=Parnassius apollo TaxID=110799 RepID=A0A8S3WR27_PARAO|nr:unnamed protein product [Parnassius apollo]
MDVYGYPYPAQFSQMLPPKREYANQGDGLREYEVGTSKEVRDLTRKLVLFEYYGYCSIGNRSGRCRDQYYYLVNYQTAQSNERTKLETPCVLGLKAKPLPAHARVPIRVRGQDHGPDLGLKVTTTAGLPVDSEN